MTCRRSGKTDLRECTGFPGFSGKETACGLELPCSDVGTRMFGVPGFLLEFAVGMSIVRYISLVDIGFSFFRSSPRTDTREGAFGVLNSRRAKRGRYADDILKQTCRVDVGGEEVGRWRSRSHWPWELFKSSYF